MKLLGIVGVSFAIAAGAQQAPDAPNLSRQQRAALRAIIGALGQGAPAVTIPDADWPLHVLRASDGSHYVAFSIHEPPGLPDGPVVIYVRLTTRPAPGQTSAPERSAVAEWLAGQTTSPPQGRRGIAFGEMPTFGAGSIATRGPGAQSQTLQLLELERQRARERREAEERQRQAALEGAETSRGPKPLMPFEDFDVRIIESSVTGPAVLRRSFTAGPGEYDLTVAWVDPGARDVASAIHIARRPVSLAPASFTELTLSSVILADDVVLRETPRAAADQTAFPYSIGPMEIHPSRDHVLTNDERLALVVQVINARGTATGKPDVVVGFRLFRRNPATEDLVGTLVPQTYNEQTLPPDFDVSLRHPLFAAVAVPLRSFKRGDYRLQITATDRIAGRGVTTEALFTIAATPAALLREAPPLAPRFDPASLAGPLQQALQQAEPPAAVQIMRGAQLASAGNDAEAIAVWEALGADAHQTVVAPLLINALLRSGQAARAIETARQALEAGVSDPRLTRQLAAAYMAGNRYAEALQVLEQRLTEAPDDLDAQWLAIHALFVGVVSGKGPGSDEAGRERLAALIATYVEANGANAPLAREWESQVR